MSSTLDQWEGEGGAIDPRPGVVLVIPRSEYERDDPELHGLIRDMRRERVEIKVVDDKYWDSFKSTLKLIGWAEEIDEA